MKKYIAIIFVILLIALSACNPIEEIQEEQLEAEIEAESGEDVEVELDDDTYTITSETDEGTVTITGSEGSGDWCDEDLFMNVEGMNTETGELSYTVEFEGIVESGEYEGLCKGKVIMDTEEGTLDYTYWFDEDEEHGHVIIVGDGIYSSYNMEYDF